MRDMNDRDSRTSDLTRLVQHVELNQSGWWKRAVERLVIACAYTLGPSSADDIRTLMAELCGGPPNSDLVSSTIINLIESGTIIDLNGLLRVSEERKDVLVRQEAEALSSEQRVRNRFKSMAQKRGLEDRAGDLWSVMETEVVLPIVKHMGAQIYKLLTFDADGSDTLELEMIDASQYDEKVRSLFADFLGPSDQDVRGFVLRRLNAQYVVDAAALSHHALEQLSHLDHRAGRVDIFLDTNVVFSVLGLHRNPEDDTAIELLRLVQILKDRVDLRLYVLPDTVKETRMVLRAAIRDFRDFRGQPNLAEAARPLSSGLTRLYFEAAARSSTPLTAQDYLGLYESDLLRLLRSKSVELYNADLSHLHVDQEVLDDLHEQEEAQQYRMRGVKPYEANLHDMVLWRFTKSRRHATVESPLEVNAWVVTLDYGLIRFDQRKNRQDAHYKTPICLDPSSLIQLFQFWVPSSVELDEALVGSVRQPLLLLNFDTQSEQVTIRILTQLSRYEGAEEFDPDVAAELLTRTALRDRLSDTSDDLSTDQQIVQEEIGEAIKHLSDQLADIRREQLTERAATAAANTTAAEERTARFEAETALASETKTRRLQEEDNQRLTATTKDLQSRLSDIEGKNQQLEGLIREQHDRAARRRELWRFGTIASVSVFVASGVLVSGSILDNWLRPYLAWTLRISTGTLLLLFGIELAAYRTRFQQSFMLKHLSRFHRWWWTYILTIAAMVIAGLLLQGLSPP